VSNRPASEVAREIANVFQTGASRDRLEERIKLLVRAAVEAERERCAGIASGYPAFSAFGDYHGHAIPAAIAAAIRFNGAKQ
jgi:hypothetical protein